MNAKTMKKINRHSRVLLMEWLKGLVPEEEHHKISASNLHSLLPSNNYLYVNKQFRLNICSDKWVRKGLKKLVSKIRLEIRYRKKIKELKKRDPFIYK